MTEEPLPAQSERILDAHASHRPSQPPVRLALLLAFGYLICGCGASHGTTARPASGPVAGPPATHVAPSIVGNWTFENQSPGVRADVAFMKDGSLLFMESVGRGTIRSSGRYRVASDHLFTTVEASGSGGKPGQKREQTMTWVSSDELRLSDKDVQLALMRLP